VHGQSSDNAEKPAQDGDRLSRTDKNSQDRAIEEPALDTRRAELRAISVPSARARAVSLLRYSPALVLVVILLADAGRFADPDLWGHIRFGQDILRHGHLPTHDPYSYSAPGHPWGDHEWLTEVALAWFYNVLGVLGLKLMKFACTAATILFLVLALAETGASTTVQLSVLCATALGLGPQMQFRPQLFTFAFLSGLLAILTRDNYRRSAPVWLAIPMLALWGNFHGGFFVGIVALSVYAGVSTLQDLVAGRGWRRGIRLGVITAAAAVATLINPHGAGNWYTVAHTMDNPVTRGLITEWQPLIFFMSSTWYQFNLADVFYIVVLGIMAALTVSFLLTPRGDDLPLVAMAAVMIVTAFVSVRNMALAVIASSVPLARHAELLAARLRSRFGRGPVAESDRAGFRWWNHAVLLAVAALLAVQTGLFSNRLRNGIQYPAGAVAFMKQHGLHGNLLCNFNWGEYLIYHCAPQSKVFIDSRYDMVYPQKVIRDYMDFHFDLPGADRVLKAYPHKFVLIAPDSGAYRLMTKQAGWKLIYRDRVAALFARADSAAAHLPGVPVIGNPPPNYFP
jgi:hypothetical protein